MRTKVMRQRAPRVRKRGGPTADPYLDQLSPRTTARCAQCGALYRNKRWQLVPTTPERTRAKMTPVLCPACRKIQDHYPNGVITIHWPASPAIREMMLNLIKNQEAWGRQVNPLERIISIMAEDATLTVTTTNERLAQRIGRAMERAFHGKSVYHWSRENKLLRVEWSHDAAPA